MKALLLALLLIGATALPAKGDYDAFGGAGDADGSIWVTGYLATGYGTASGVWPTYGHTAACPGTMAFGQQITLELRSSFLTVTCEDRTPGSPWLIDVFVSSVADAKAITGQHKFWLLPQEP